MHLHLEKSKDLRQMESRICLAHHPKRRENMRFLARPALLRCETPPTQPTRQKVTSTGTKRGPGAARPESYWGLPYGNSKGRVQLEGRPQTGQMQTGSRTGGVSE